MLSTTLLEVFTRSRSSIPVQAADASEWISVAACIPRGDGLPKFAVPDINDPLIRSLPIAALAIACALLDRQAAPGG